jgi:hypothetical protein
MAAQGMVLHVCVDSNASLGWAVHGLCPGRHRRWANITLSKTGQGLVDLMLELAYFVDKRVFEKDDTRARYMLPKPQNKGQ